VTPAALPFLKWAGGKGRVLDHLDVRLPRRGRHFEPFLGGGAFFFARCPREAVLGDANPHLVAAYRGVRDDVEQVIGLLEAMQADYAEQTLQGQTPDERRAACRPFFEHVRDGGPPLDEAGAAAWLLFVNRAGFNGLYRVNRSGRCNTPQGKTPAGEPILDLVDADRLRAASRALQGAVITVGDFAGIVAEAGPGDVVYFDPPYVPISASASFTSYTAAGFGLADHRRLRDLALELAARGVAVLISNSGTLAVMDLYTGPEWRILPISVPRSISQDTSKREAVLEVIIQPVTGPRARQPVTLPGVRPVKGRTVLEVTPQQRGRIDQGMCGCGCYTCPHGHNFRPRVRKGEEHWSGDASAVPALECPVCKKGGKGGAPAPRPGVMAAVTPLPRPELRDWRGATGELADKPDPNRKWATNACKARVHRDNEREGRSVSHADRARLAKLEEARGHEGEAARLEREAARLTRQATGLRRQADSLKVEASGQTSIVDRLAAAG